MRQRLGLWMIRVGRRLAKIKTPEIVWPDEAIVSRAQALTAEWHQPDFSGEYKRHQVLARLIKDYPDVSRRTLAMAIELGLPE